MTESSTPDLELATFGGGCFWCLEAVFELIQGVQSVTSGYTGGAIPNPTYEQVCTGRSGHAEVIQLAFDPSRIRYQDLLDVFFEVHDPTTRNRQGADVGTQYRSVVYYHSEEQHQQVLKAIQDRNTQHLHPAPIVTEVSPATVFYPAEDYHQGYFRGNGRAPYCQLVVSPKVAKFRSQFARLAQQ